MDVIISTECPICRAHGNLVVPLREFLEYYKGGDPFKCFKKVAPAHKIELVVSGMCDECFTDWAGDLEDVELEEIKGRD